MTGPTDPATLAQFKVLATQAADIALANQADKFARMIQEGSGKAVTQVELPGPVKWAAGIISAVLTAAIIGIFFWLVTSVNEMQQTLVRIDERQKAQVETLDSRFGDHERRITRLERTSNQQGGNGG